MYFHIAATVLLTSNNATGNGTLSLTWRPWEVVSVSGATSGTFVGECVSLVIMSLAKKAVFYLSMPTIRVVPLISTKNVLLSRLSTFNMKIKITVASNSI